MNITEVIKKLEEIRAAHGDLPCVAYGATESMGEVLSVRATWDEEPCEDIPLPCVIIAPFSSSS
jgi:hypothetical protein